MGNLLLRLARRWVSYLLYVLGGVKRTKEAEYSGWRDGPAGARICVAHDAGGVVPGGIEPLDDAAIRK
jgi:hypothetical protein